MNKRLKTEPFSTLSRLPAGILRARHVAQSLICHNISSFSRTNSNNISPQIKIRNILSPNRIAFP